MNSTVQGQIELSAVLNLIPYLDTNFKYDKEINLFSLIDKNKDKFKDNETFKILNSAIEQNPSYGDIVLVNQSLTNNTESWKDDLIQGCTFRDPEGNYYVTYRGTGDGRWADNGSGMTVVSTEMQESAKNYFDDMAKRYFIDASANGKQIIVTGHSKGGNEAQYVYMASKYEYLIDSCYSYDGQGFSEKAVNCFIEKYGYNYEEKLSNMYSICGENDYVHDLGHVIIPEKNTYFIETYGNDYESLHALENMICNGTGEYTGLQWSMDNGNISNGEQGEIGKLAKKISKTMMNLDEENLNGTAIALMTLIDPYSNDDILGNIDVSWTDYIDLIAHGLPAILETILFTDEGNVILSKLINCGAEYLYNKYGIGGTISGFILLAFSLVYIAKFVSVVVILANILDFAIDVINKIVDISEQIKNCLLDIKESTISIINKIITNIEKKSIGYKYSINNPQIKLDTFKLKNYASRIYAVNSRISKIDRRMDSLYWRVGLLDLWNLIQADLMTKYSWRLLRVASYLNETASDFEKIENEIINSL